MHKMTAQRHTGGEGPWGLLHGGWRGRVVGEEGWGHVCFHANTGGPKSIHLHVSVDI